MKISFWRLAAYALLILCGLAVGMPALLEPAALRHWPDWLPHRALTLGLDLRGGSYLLLRLDGARLRTDMRDDAVQEARDALRAAGLQGRIAIDGAGGATIALADAPAAAAARQVLVRHLGAGVEVAAEPGAAGSAAVLRLRLAAAAVAERQADALAQSIEILRRRLDEPGVAEPSLQRVGGDRIMVQLPGVEDPGTLRTLLGSTAQLAFHLGEPLAAGAPAPAGLTVLPGVEGGSRFAVAPRPALLGERLRNATAGFDQRLGQPVVSFQLDRAGARQFAELTQRQVGRPLVVVLDDRVLSAPVIREPILDGSGQISGGFDFRESSQLAALLRAGALPVPLVVEEARTVGAELGEDSIAAGAWNGLAGFLLVCGAMAWLYGRWGLAANAALAINAVLTIAAMTLLGATLTLPGIAGMILGLGLAVDANVLINERVREESRRGSGAATALQAGFSRAYRTVVDSNVTTLLAMLMLFWFGSGPVRGFAVTMAMSIGISMFTAVTVVMAAMSASLRLWPRRRFEIRPFVSRRLIPLEPRIRFMRARHLGLAVSLALSLASVGLVAAPGLNYGIDFRGGTLIEATASRPLPLPQLRTGLSALGLGDVSLQQFGDGRTVQIRFEDRPGGPAAQEAALALARQVLAAVAPDSRVDRVEIVGPRVSAELVQSGLLSVLFAAAAIFAYIWLRFEWPFAVGAVLTLLLDVTKTLGLFALTGLDFGLTAVVALLTLIGYSINDKVVVYDRMRENLRLCKAMTLREVIDLSINQTLARSLYTSVTALLAILPLAVWGGHAVQSFAIPMAFGIVVAASSSVFIAAPILLFLGDWRRRRRPAVAAALAAEAG